MLLNGSYFVIHILLTMKSLKKALKLAFIILLMFLASIGIGLVGGISLPFSGKKENTAEIKIELVESDEDSTDNMRVDIKH